MISKIAVIIVTHNGSRYISQCLASVFRHANGATAAKGGGYANAPIRMVPYGVIVVDNNSSDDTVSIVEKLFQQVELIKLENNLGFVGGNNIGISHALKQDYDAVVLLNQDTEVEYDWLVHLAKAAQDDKAGIVQAMLLLANERALANNVGNALHYLGFGFVKHYRERVDSWYHRPPFEIGYASGAGMLIKREVLEKIRSFDDKFFMYHEDLDLCWRTRLAGYKITIAPQAVVYHHYQFNRNKKIFYWTERNRWACLLQNYSLATLLKLSPILLFVELAMLVYGLVSGWLGQKIKGYVWLMAHLPSVLSARKSVQSLRTVSDCEVMRHMEAKLEFSEVDNFWLRRVVSPVVGWYYKIVLGI